MNTQLRCLSGDVNGIGILVVHTTNTDADTIHTALTSTSDGEGDQVWLWADNPDTAIHTLTIWWGGTTAITNQKTYVLPALTSDIPLVRGRTLRGGLIVKASCETANMVSICGHVNRITIA